MGSDGWPVGGPASAPPPPPVSDTTTSCGRFELASRELAYRPSLEVGCRTKTTAPLPVIARVTSRSTYLPEPIEPASVSTAPLAAGLLFQVMAVSDQLVPVA